LPAPMTATVLVAEGVEDPPVDVDRYAGRPTLALILPVALADLLADVQVALEDAVEDRPERSLRGWRPRRLP